MLSDTLINITRAYDKWTRRVEWNSHEVLTARDEAKQEAD